MVVFILKLSKNLTKNLNGSTLPPYYVLLLSVSSTFILKILVCEIVPVFANQVIYSYAYIIQYLVLS